MASALFVSLLASEGVENNPPKILGTAGRMTMKFLQDIKYHEEARNPKKFDLTHLVCKLWGCKVKKRLYSLYSGNVTS